MKPSQFASAIRAHDRNAAEQLAGIERAHQRQKVKEAALDVAREILDQSPALAKQFGITHVMGGPCMNTAPADEKFVPAYGAITCTKCRVAAALTNEPEGAVLWSDSVLAEDQTSEWAKRYAKAFHLKRPVPIWQSAPSQCPVIDLDEDDE